MKAISIFVLGIFTCAILSLTFSKNEEQGLVNQTEMSSLLFRNCANVISFNLPKDGNIEYTCSHARIIKGTNNNEITVIPSSDSTVDLSIKYDGKTYKQRYKSVKVPEPTFELRTLDGKLADQKTGTLSPGPAGLKLVVKANSFFLSIHPTDSRYSAEEWSIILVRGKRPVAMVRVEQENE